MPEEVLYLMERGSLFCWKESEVSASMKDELESDFDDCNLTIGTPMSVQQGFTELIGVDGLELQHYLVSIIGRNLCTHIEGNIGICLSKTAGLYC
jgi:tRNA-splicing endonuclease subunit Sen54